MMAPPFRITTSFYPLLNCNYSKCSVVITRLKSRKHSRELKINNSRLEHSGKITEGFYERHRSREQQAKKSVIVQLQDFKDIGECREHLEKYGPVKNIFHYTAKLENPNMLLVEYNTKNSVLNLLSSTTYVDVHNHIPIPTTTVHYRSTNAKLTKNTTSFPKYCHHYPTWTLIRSTLIQSKSVSEQMLLLYKTLKLSDIDIRLRYYTAYQLYYALSRLFPTISILPFGSSVSGLGQLGCDLDLICTFANSSKVPSDCYMSLIFASKPFNLVERTDQQDFLKPLSILMQKFIPGISNVQNILNARVPIVKFMYGTTSMHCDLSSSNLSGYYMSELLYVLGEIDFRVKPLIFTIRKWAECNGVTSDIPGQKITNFCLTLLVVHYLQHIKILPPVEKIIKGPLSSHMTTTVHNIAENRSKVGDLLFGFFEYYATFDFSMFAICVLEGKLKHKRDISALYIYNPLDLSLNVSRNITSAELKIFTNRVLDALNIFSNGSQINILQLIDPSFPNISSTSESLGEHYQAMMKDNNENKSEVMGRLLKNSEDDTVKVEQINQVREIIK
ncbi:mitochondrial poly(A) polymerase isoform X2 [Augochlora pura]